MWNVHATQNPDVAWNIVRLLFILEFALCCSNNCVSAEIMEQNKGTFYQLVCLAFETEILLTLFCSLSNTILLNDKTLKSEMTQ